jgi:hypothetical protein
MKNRDYHSDIAIEKEWGQVWVRREVHKIRGSFLFPSNPFGEVNVKWFRMIGIHQNVISEHSPKKVQFILI